MYTAGAFTLLQLKTCCSLPAGQTPALPAIVHGFADCLWAGINSPAAGSDESSDGDSGAPTQANDVALSGDPRALLVLQLLLACVDDEAPSLTHLLLGMDVGGGFNGDTSAFEQSNSTRAAMTHLCNCGLLPVAGKVCFRRQAM